MIDEIMIAAKNAPRVNETLASYSYISHLNNFLDKCETEYYHIPLANVSETEEHISIEIALPGISLHDIEITVDDEYLVVNSNPESIHKMQYKKFNKREYNMACFYRAVKLPKEASGRQFLKHYNNGATLLKNITACPWILSGQKMAKQKKYSLFRQDPKRCISINNKPSTVNKKSFSTQRLVLRL